MMTNKLFNLQLFQYKAISFSGRVIKERPPREKTVAVYGPAQITEKMPIYKFSKKLGEALAKADFGILTGGGSGAMKGITEGANRKGGHTIGVAISGIVEEPNRLCKENYVFNDFSSRIDKGYEPLSGLSLALPGGIGTIEEVVKKWVELYTNKTLYPSQKQIILLEFQDDPKFKNYWKKFLRYLTQHGPIATGLTKPETLNIFKIAKSIPEAVDLLKQKVAWTTGLKKQVKLPPKYSMVDTAA